MGYPGNKRNECEDIYNEIKDKLDNITTIIEPFCGTAALSYYIHLNHPKRFKYILNDNNKFLIQLYVIAKDETKLIKLINLLDNKIKGLNKEKYDIIFKEDNLLSWIITHKIYNIRAGLFPLPPRKIITTFNYLKDCPIIQFLRTENITFYNTDAINIMDKYKNDNTNFIFLDPPYLVSCNDFYKDAKVNIYEYLYNNKISDMKALLITCLESNWIIKLLFNGQIKKEYGKKYEGSKKHTTHLIISNHL
jgi:site-specific DNA-adenine methylase